MALTAPARVSSRCTVALIATCTTLAAAVRLQRLSVPGYLYGPVGYDEGVYFGDAMRVVHGYLPYRDFVAVHPPGIMELLAPIAASADVLGTSRAFAVARVLTALAGAASVLVVGLLLRHRGALPTALACGVTAVHPGSVIAANGVLLEPWLVLFCLLGLLAAFDGEHLSSPRRLFASGLLLGFAGAVKIWAIGPAVVLAVVCAARPQRAGRFAAGVATGFVAAVLPFAVVAPRAFVRQVVIVQLARGGPRTPMTGRLQQMLGIAGLNTPPWTAWALAAGVTVLAAGSLGSLRRTRRPTGLEAATGATAAVTSAMLLLPALFLSHYAAFCVPFVALALARGAPTGRPLPDRPRRAVASRIVGAALALGVLVTGSNELRSIAHPRPLPDVVTALRSAIPPGACVVTNDPSATLSADRFVPARDGCPEAVDFFGARIDLNGSATTGQYRPAFQNFWAGELNGAQYLLLQDVTTNASWRPDIRSYFRTHFVLILRLADGGHHFFLFARS